jgi:1-acyl-sn-glycerol-3-phosphate acyltransferase
LSQKRSIDDWAFNYWLLQCYAKLCFRIYYRKIELVHFDRIPANQPVILAPNHQNALMDAMVLVCNTNYQNVFLARADIFKGKRMIKFLTFLNIMPVFRIRDGIENVKRNDEVFEKTVKVLHNRLNPLILFAEGNHGDKRRIRPLVKGLFRIAFQAQEKFGATPGVKIVPVGIDYGHYQHFRTTLFVNVGEPIEVAPYYDEYRDNPVTAINRLKDIFAVALSKQMIDIQTEEYYGLYMHLREIFRDEMKKVLNNGASSLSANFNADKIMIDMLNKELVAHPETISNLNTLVNRYIQGVDQVGFRAWVFNKSHYNYAGLILSVILKIVLFPLFVFGMINNALPYWLAASKVRNIKDTQFHSSFKYVIGMIGFPIWYMAIAGILAVLQVTVWWILLYIISLPLAGLAAFEYFIRWKKLKAKIRYNLMHRKHVINNLQNDRKNIMAQMHDILKRQKDIC